MGRRSIIGMWSVVAVAWALVLAMPAEATTTLTSESPAAGKAGTTVTLTIYGSFMAQSDLDRVQAPTFTVDGGSAPPQQTMTLVGVSSGVVRVGRRVTAVCTVTPAGLAGEDCPFAVQRTVGFAPALGRRADRHHRPERHLPLEQTAEGERGLSYARQERRDGVTRHGRQSMAGLLGGPLTPDGSMDQRPAQRVSGAGGWTGGKP